MKGELGVAVKLLEGGGGEFEVKADDRLIYSKRETGRFPENSEIMEALK